MKKQVEKIFSQKWLPFAIIFTLGFLLYAQTFFFGFSYLDDNNLILDKGFWLGEFSNFFRFFQTDVFSTVQNSGYYYRPIFSIFLMLDYQFFGAAPFMFHFTSVLCHLVAASLIFIFLQKLKYTKEVSFLAALIFLVHPALSQAVAWVPGRNDSLLTVFVLAAAVRFVDFWRSGEKRYFWEHLFFFALAIFTKETALFALPVFLFLAWLLGGQKVFSRRNIKMFAMWLPILAFWFVLRHFALINSPGMPMEDMFKSVFFNWPAILQLVGKIIFPFNLSVLPIIQDTVFYYGLAALILLVVSILATKERRGRYIFFGLAWFLIFLLPSFIRPNSALAADFIEHRLYLPLVGFLIFLLEIEPLRSWRVEKKILAGGAVAIIMLFIFLNFRHTPVFKDRLSFWQNAAENSPHYPLARRNLGAMYYLDGRLEDAEKEFLKALEINPSEPMAHNNLGLIYASWGNLKQAQEEYEKEITINPNYDDVYFNLGLLYYRQNQIGEAIEELKKASGLNKYHQGALLSLAEIYYNQKDFKEAAFYAEKIHSAGFPLPPELAKLLNPLTLLQLKSSVEK